MNQESGIKNKKKRGFSLIEMLIFLSVFVFAATGFLRVISAGMRNLSDAKNKIAAAELANERLEIIRNMPYEKIAMQGDDPTGDLEASYEAVRSNTNFTIHTSVNPVDDPYDHLFSAGDSKPKDYKHVSLLISWNSQGGEKSITVATNIAPPGTEELYTGGILSLEVRDMAGNPVTEAKVEINRPAGPYSKTEFTVGDGKVYLIGLDAADKEYRIKVSKDGYFTVETKAPYGSTAYDPVDEHASVVEASIWPQTIEFNRLANIGIKTRKPSGESVPSIDFTLEGGRKLGDTVPAASPVYSYAPANSSTDANGSFNLSDLSSGVYVFTLRDTPANSGYEFWKMSNNFGGIKSNFFAEPGATTQAEALLLPKNEPSVLLSATDKVDGTTLSDVALTLKDPSNNELNAATDPSGQAYFGNLPENGEYQLHATLEGYKDLDQGVTVSDLSKTVIQLEKN